MMQGGGESAQHLADAQAGRGSQIAEPQGMRQLSSTTDDFGETAIESGWLLVELAHHRMQPGRQLPRGGQEVTSRETVQTEEHTLVFRNIEVPATLEHAIGQRQQVRVFFRKGGNQLKATDVVRKT